MFLSPFAHCHNATIEAQTGTQLQNSLYPKSSALHPLVVVVQFKSITKPDKVYQSTQGEKTLFLAKAMALWFQKKLPLQQILIDKCDRSKFFTVESVTGSCMKVKACLAALFGCCSHQTTILALGVWRQPQGAYQYTPNRLDPSYSVAKMRHFWLIAISIIHFLWESGRLQAERVVTQDLA